MTKRSDNRIRLYMTADQIAAAIKNIGAPSTLEEAIVFTAADMFVRVLRGEAVDGLNLDFKRWLVVVQEMEEE